MLDGLGLGFVIFYDNLNIFIFSRRYVFSVCDPRGSDRWIDLKFIVGYIRIYPETWEVLEEVSPHFGDILEFS